MINLQREGKHLEYKEAHNSIPKAFWETYSAFANTDGGTIILGIAEPKKFQYKVTGVNNPEKRLTELWNLLFDKDKVSYNLLDESLIKVEKSDKKSIIIIKVPEAPYMHKPIYINGHRENCYKRYDDGDRKINNEEYRYFVANSRDDIDNELLNNYDMADINLPDVIHYRDILVANTNDEKYLSMSPTELLINLGAFKRDRQDNGNYKLTTGGLLFFGKYNSIVDRFPGFQLDYFEKQSALETDWQDRISSGDKDFPELNVYSFYLKVLTKLIDSIKDGFKLSKGLTRSSYRADLSIVVREALINTLMHAYYDFSQPIKIYNYAEYFEFFNPGDMRISKEEFIHGGNSKIRNSTISILFRRNGYSERAGSGGPRIFDTTQKLKLRTPEIQITEFATTVRIWKVDIMTLFKSRSANEQKILNFVIKNNFIRKADLGQIGLTEYTFRTTLNGLIADEIISKIGRGPATRYRLATSQEASIHNHKRVLRKLEDRLFPH